MKRTLASLMLLVTVSLQAAVAPLHIRAEGHVAHPGTISLPPTAHYADAAIAAWPISDAYPLGAALLRVSQIETQIRLKAGIIDSLSVIAANAGRDGNDAAADSARRMIAWIKPLPITGRKAVALLDPRVVELTPDRNLPLDDGDVLRYPGRPSFVRVVGAVTRPCDLDFVPLQDARRYLAGCAQTQAADIETFYVIQPDGAVIKQGRALWNRSEPLALAPGAILYVPLKVALTQSTDSDLDRDFAAFVATQVLP